MYNIAVNLRNKGVYTVEKRSIMWIVFPLIISFLFCIHIIMTYSSELHYYSPGQSSYSIIENMSDVIFLPIKQEHKPALYRCALFRLMLKIILFLLTFIVCRYRKYTKILTDIRLRIMYFILPYFNGSKYRVAFLFA